MLKLEMNAGTMELELRGSDELIIDELSLAVIRIFYALEHSDGNPAKDNLTRLILSLISRQNQTFNPPC